jgi:hypothetical protein
VDAVRKALNRSKGVVGSADEEEEREEVVAGRQEAEAVQYTAPAPPAADMSVKKRLEAAVMIPHINPVVQSLESWAEGNPDEIDTLFGCNALPGLFRK